jgi:hypothetical protein
MRPIGSRSWKSQGSEFDGLGSVCLFETQSLKLRASRVAQEVVQTQYYKKMEPNTVVTMLRLLIVAPERLCQHLPSHCFFGERRNTGKPVAMEDTSLRLEVLFSWS